MKVLKNNKGSTTILLNGFGYNDKKLLKNGSVRWRCQQRVHFNCIGSITTDSSISTIVCSKNHNHDADFTWAEAQEIRQDIKSMATNGRAKPIQLVTDVLSNADNTDAALKAGTKDALRQMAKRIQRGDRPKNPPSMEEIPIPFPAEYGEYLIHDNQDPLNRIIIFASDAGLEILGSADVWFMDGTFYTCPNQFEQLYIIRAPLNDTCRTVMYAYLPARTQAVYTEMLEALVSACTQRNITLDPVRIVADYEIGLHNAVTAVFESEASISGCFYHLTQSTWRRVQSEGLQKLYNENTSVREFCGKIDGLAFLPVEDVKDGMKLLYDEAPDHLRCLVEYFDANYVNGGFKAKANKDNQLIIRLHRVPPKFPPSVWNVHSTTLEGGDRTNNQCESFNSYFKTLVGCANPSLWTVSHNIWKDIRMVKLDIIRAARGILPPKRVKKGTSIHQQVCKKLCEKYINKEKTMQEFLQSIGKSIRIAKKK